MKNHDAGAKLPKPMEALAEVAVALNNLAARFSSAIKKAFHSVLPARKVRKLPRLQRYGINRHRRRKTLVLDLDGTLVHCKLIRVREENFEASSSVVPEAPLPGFDFVVVGRSSPGQPLLALHIKERPGASALLRDLSQLYEIAVYSAATKWYVDSVLNFLDPSGTVVPPSHRLSREDCVWLGKGNRGAAAGTKTGTGSGSGGKGGHASRHMKDLGMLGRDLRNVVMVEDNPTVFSALHARNVVLVSPFDEKPCVFAAPAQWHCGPKHRVCPSLPQLPLHLHHQRVDELRRLCNFLKDIAHSPGDVRDHIAAFQFQLLT